MRTAIIVLIFLSNLFGDDYTEISEKTRNEIPDDDVHDDETSEDCGPHQGAGVKCYYDGEHNDCKENYVILNVHNFQHFS